VSEKMNVKVDETVAATANDVARGIWFASGKDEPNLEDAEKFLELLASCAYALSGRRSTIKFEK
jgi:hypothetical protein